MKKKKLALIIGLLAVIAIVVGVLWFGIGGRTYDTVEYEKKAEALKSQVVTEELIAAVGENPAGAVGNVVFLSVCNTEKRASVYCGTGTSLEEAWEAANEAAKKALTKSGLSVKWLKADVVYICEPIGTQEVGNLLKTYQDGYFRFGIAFDTSYSQAFLEAELNGNRIYDYENGSIDLTLLNSYIKKTKKRRISSLPAECTIFQCYGWISDEEDTIYALSGSGSSYGRRSIESMGSGYASDLVESASEYLVNQVGEDGKFTYGYYPRTGEEIEGYNILRHADAITSLLDRYQLFPSGELKATIDSTLDYLVEQIVYKDEATAYLYEEKDAEIKLGGNGLAITAMTEYMEVFDTDTYKTECEALGNGILSMMKEEGGFYHVFNGDFSAKEEYRTRSYDGEASYALCLLYGLTKEERWLEAAKTAVNYFIAEDYTKYKDHWVAFTMKEITKYVTDDASYYIFALRLGKTVAEELEEAKTSEPAYMELLLAILEIYDRATEQEISVGGFDLEALASSIFVQADRMLDGYFFPEYAMYMEKPSQVLNAFMVRSDGYRVRIDDIQHGINAFYLYDKNYTKVALYYFTSQFGQ